MPMRSQRQPAKVGRFSLSKRLSDDSQTTQRLMTYRKSLSENYRIGRALAYLFFTTSKHISQITMWWVDEKRAVDTTIV
jgi:hypothetical protein